MHGSAVIALRGRASGTARLTLRGGALTAVFSLRGGITPACAFFVERNGRIQSAIPDEDGRCVLNSGEVCAAAVFGADARLVSFGTLGSCVRDTGKLLAELAIRAAALLDKRAPPERAADQNITVSSPPVEADAPSTPHAGPHSDENGFSAPVSQAAKEILGMARELFSPLDGAGPSAKSSEPKAGEVFEPIKNPFPRTYPNSEWKRREGDAVLYGSAQTRRGIIKMAARPASAGMRRSAGERYVISAEGLGYFVKAEPNARRT